ncbi:hypothetical protein IWQ56_001070 [Coemansia nantahalensis]|nr:hypothetical protein IWQ56_001070 [Coemansia nantahalensis]
MVAPAPQLPAAAWPYGDQQHYGPQHPMALGLEQELELQQQQFQQQFLQQYHQMQLGHAGQYQDWVHDGFGGQIAPPPPPPPQQQQQQHQFALGLQHTPHTPDVAQHYAPSPQTTETPYAHDAFPQPPPAREPRRQHRPWVQGRAHARHVETSPQTAETDDSDASTSSGESASSDESAFGINPDEEVPLAAANTAAPAGGSPRISAARRGQTATERPALQVDTSYCGDSDDDLPLSVISSASTHGPEALAVLRRARTVAPPPVTRGAKGAAPALIARGSAKSRSLLVHSNCPSSASGASLRSRAANPDSDDEDAPLDRLQADLVSGIRVARSGLGGPGSRTHSSASQRPPAVTATTIVPVHNDASDADAPNAETSGTAPAAARRLAASPLPSDSSSIHSGDDDGDGDPGSGCRSASSQSQVVEEASMPPSAQHSRTASASAPEPEADGDWGPGTTEMELPPLPPEAPTRKTQGYLPMGTGLPALVPRQRSAKPRAAVQYVALADMLEAAEGAHGGLSDDDAHPGCTDPARPAGGEGSKAGGKQSVASFETVSSGAGTLMEVLRTGPVELLTASTEHSGSKAAIDRVVLDDYGDVDQLLSDLEGIMNGSLAARRRFSLTLMRRSLAVSSGLVEAFDYSDVHPGGKSPSIGGSLKPAVEFQPLEIGHVGSDPSGALGAGMDLGDMFLSALSTADETGQDAGNGNNNNDDEDSRPLNQLPSEIAGSGAGLRQPTVYAEAAPMLPPLDLHLTISSDAPARPTELTRTQKIQKALEKLELLEVRKVSIRIYVQDARRYYTFSLTEFTTCEMIIGDMMKSGVIDPDKSNWALFELIDHFGIERPLNQFENLMGVVESWEPRSNNYIIAKGYSQLATLTLLGGIHPGEHAMQSMLYYRVKKNKWQKGIFCLHGHTLLLVKDGRSRARKESHDLMLANNDVYTPFEPLRGAPTRFVFGLKSEMAMQMFEKPDEDYVKWFAVQTLDSLRQWLQVLRFSKNQIKFCQLLERRVVESCKAKPSEQKAPFKPLVELALDSPSVGGGDGSGDGGSDGDSVKQDSDTAAKIVSLLSRTAASTKYDPEALLRVVAQHGIDTSDFGILGASSGADGEGQPGAGEKAANGPFQPGSLLSQAKKSAIDALARPQPETELFAKGSLLSQPRESKALAASRAMQRAMDGGNVFAQTPLLEVVEELKPRPAHVGGAPVIHNAQFPLVQLEDPGAARQLPGPAALPAGLPEEPVFGGLLAQVPGPALPGQARSNVRHY